MDKLPEGPAVALLVALAAGPCAARDLVVTVQDSGGAPIADAVVTVTGAAAAAPPPAAAAVMRQRDKAFVPYVLAVPAGTAVSFPNEDPFLHHVYSFSEAKSFALELYGKGDTPSVTFERPGVIGLGCNIHDTMRGYIVVSADPWVMVTGADGSARFGGLAAGPAQVSVWHHRQAAPPVAPAEVAEDAAAHALILALKPAPPPALAPHEAGDY